MRHGCLAQVCHVGGDVGDASLEIGLVEDVDGGGSFSALVDDDGVTLATAVLELLLVRRHLCVVACEIGIWIDAKKLVLAHANTELIAAI